MITHIAGNLETQLLHLNTHVLYFLFVMLGSDPTFLLWWYVMVRDLPRLSYRFVYYNTRCRQHMAQEQVRDRVGNSFMRTWLKDARGIKVIGPCIIRDNVRILIITLHDVWCFNPSPPLPSPRNISHFRGGVGVEWSGQSSSTYMCALVCPYTRTFALCPRS